MSLNKKISSEGKPISNSVTCLVTIQIQNYSAELKFFAERMSVFVGRQNQLSSQLNNYHLRMEFALLPVVFSNLR